MGGFCHKSLVGWGRSEQPKRVASWGTGLDTRRRLALPDWVLARSWHGVRTKGQAEKHWGQHRCEPGPRDQVLSPAAAELRADQLPFLSLPIPDGRGSKGHSLGEGLCKGSDFSLPPPLRASPSSPLSAMWRPQHPPSSPRPSWSSCWPSSSSLRMPCS